MRTTVFEYESFEQLQAELAHTESERELELSCCPEVRDGEWLLATFKVGTETTSLAGCAMLLEREVRLTFEDRDWQALSRFASGTAPPSIIPLYDTSTPATVLPPPDCPVLVIDDDADVQQVVRAILEAKGFVAQSAGSGEEAFDMLSSSPVKLIIVDWELPGMSGVDFCRRLRQTEGLRDMPVLVLTAHPSQSAILEAFDAGADDFVAKPFRSHELGARILGLLGRGHTEPLRHAAG